MLINGIQPMVEISFYLKQVHGKSESKDKREKPNGEIKAKERVGSIQPHWRHHSEFGDSNIKLAAIHDPFHQISTPHFS